MAILSTGPIENRPVGGVRPTQQVTVKIINTDSANFSTVFIQGYHLNGTRTLYVSELFTVAPNQVITKNYFANFDAFEFVFTISGPAEESTEISVWGKSGSGQLVTAHRLVSDELLGSEVAGPQGIVDIRFEGSNDPIPFDGSGSAMVELTLPQITLEPNQVVKLDAFSNINFINVQSYSVNSFISRNPGDIVTVDNDAIFQDPNQPNFEQVTVTTSLTWVDDPGPGSYVYTFTIIGLAPFGITEGSIDSRGFTAMIINTNG